MVSRGQARGHARVMENLGGKWLTGCRCAWSQEVRTGSDAKAAYAIHLQEERAKPHRACIDCERSHPVQHMSRSHRNLCKPCARSRIRKWSAENPERYQEQVRRSHLRLKYGMTLEEYDEMLSSQGGVCAICQGQAQDSRGFKPHVDHCHRTGRVRGILCGRCNKALGQFKDDPKLIRSALAYLLRNQTEESPL